MTIVEVILNVNFLPKIILKTNDFFINLIEAHEQLLSIHFENLKTNKSFAEDSRPIELLHVFSEVRQLI